MKSLMLLLQRVLQDMEYQCDTSTARDLKTITRRVNMEGVSFLTITLANFGADLQKGLDQGFVANDHFMGFSRSGGLPRFLSGFLSQIFDSVSGVLLDTPSVAAIHCVRQLTLMWSKMLLPCTSARDRAAITKYIECEKELRNVDINGNIHAAEFQRLSSLLFGHALYRVQERLAQDFRPKHGPGATADRLSGARKYTQSEWPVRLEEQFSSVSCLVPNDRFYDYDRTELLEPMDERPVRVVTVPKTLKTPRIIAIEPTCMQYVQQGIMELLYEELESSQSLSSKFIGFTDAVPNQDLARSGSLLGDTATLDLSEASDRVSNQLVRLLMANTPNLANKVEACRSRKADVPGHGVIRLAKFASMGSALCFPVEAMVFITCVFLGIQQKLNTRLTTADINRYVGQVRVYGDDIIVPVDFVSDVTSILESFGFKVNEGKSFWTGKFRESCGKDYYAGTDVSIVRIRHNIPSSRRDVEAVTSLASTRNQFYLAGYWSVARHLDEVLESILGHFPLVEATSPLLGRVSVAFPYDEGTWHRDYQHPLVTGWRVVARYGKGHQTLTGVGALQKFFLKRGFEPSTEGHLERQGRPDAVSLKLGLACPY